MRAATGLDGRRVATAATNASLSGGGGGLCGPFPFFPQRRRPSCCRSSSFAPPARSGHVRGGWALTAEIRLRDSGGAPASTRRGLGGGTRPPFFGHQPSGGFSLHQFLLSVLHLLLHPPRPRSGSGLLLFPWRQRARGGLDDELEAVSPSSVGAREATARADAHGEAVTAGVVTFFFVTVSLSLLLSKG
jgi:hypothetical protein